MGKSTPETTDWGCFVLPISDEIGNGLWLLSISLSTVHCASVPQTSRWYVYNLQVHIHHIHGMGQDHVQLYWSFDWMKEIRQTMQFLLLYCISTYIYIYTYCMISTTKGQWIFVWSRDDTKPKPLRSRNCWWKPHCLPVKIRILACENHPRCLSNLHVWVNYNNSLIWILRS